MKSLLIIVLGLFYCLNGLYAQETENKRKDVYFETVKKLNLSKNPDYYYKRHVNLDKVKELKKAGFDIYSYDKKAGIHTYKEAALLSDIVVSGTLISKEYHGDQKNLFHSTYKLKVERTYKGENLPLIIYINLYSGMVGNSYQTISDEPELYLGDRAIFFLNFLDFEGMKLAQKDGLLNQQINAEERDGAINFMLDNKFSIRNENIFNDNNEKVESFEKAVETIELINKVNQSN
ncbi:MAG TPA: hypothetical protein VLB84_10860 [Bacteroidia bacterium]|nr:hypothetical protein [Bacteroidia bacterium]